MTEILFYTLLVGALLVSVHRLYKGRLKYQTQYRVRQYDDMASFEKGLNAAAEDGWELESWDTEPLYDWDTIKAQGSGVLKPLAHSSFQVYRVVYTREVEKHETWA